MLYYVDTLNMEVRLDRIFDFNFLYVMELLIGSFIFRLCLRSFIC